MAIMIATIAGCTSPFALTPENQEDWYSHSNPGEFRKHLAELNANDGIDEAEACLLSDLYFRRYEGECGAAGPCYQTRKAWVFDTVIGYGAASGAVIKVNKVTGEVSHRDHPTSAPPWYDLMEMAKRW